eukprot:CAMPEP_0113876830 /NCGR_PEP_ID=MMETSP0780_2-20120614/5712_1 /TAXON_ID=652834 /ORGANISM="Palpitomonas bilix" /LENGTH=1098 /DNA_ID=CAMNT_0000862967 /DNA_START=230 /DNA_END=3526 /DNA_ORIENTATION=+ /assembly_acc=CAM_ASM_000599
MSTPASLLEEDKKEVIKRSHFGSVWSICFSPNGRYAVTASEDKHAILWEGRRGKGWKSGGRNIPHPQPVTCAAFHPHAAGGMMFATGCGDGQVRFFRVRVKRVSGDDRIGEVGSTTPVGKEDALLGEGERRIGLEDEEWEVNCIEGRRETLRPAQEKVTSLAFSPCGTRMAISLRPSSNIFIYALSQPESGDGGVGHAAGGWLCITLVTELERAHFQSNLGRPAFSSISPSALMLATMGVEERRAVKVWIRTGRKQEKCIKKEVEEAWDNIRSLATSAGVTRIAFASSFPSFSQPSLFASTALERNKEACMRELSRRASEGGEDEYEATTKSDSGSTGMDLDILAAGCENGEILVWTVDSSTSPPTFSRASVLNGVHYTHVRGLVFAASNAGAHTLMATADIKGVVCIWRGPPCPYYTSPQQPDMPRLSTSTAPAFVQMQKVEMGGAYKCTVNIHDCAFSPQLSAFACVEHTLEGNVYFWPCRWREHVDQPEEQTKVIQGKEPYPLPQGIFAECLSECELDRVQDECFPFSSFPYHFEEIDKPRMRPTVASLLDVLGAAGCGDSNKLGKGEAEEREDAAQEHEKKKSEASPPFTEVTLSAIRQMLVASAGLFSSDPDVQKIVHEKLLEIEAAIPTLLKICKHNQSVLKTISEEMQRFSQERLSNGGEDTLVRAGSIDSNGGSMRSRQSEEEGGSNESRRSRHGDEEGGSEQPKTNEVEKKETEHDVEKWKAFPQSSMRSRVIEKLLEGREACDRARDQSHSILSSNILSCIKNEVTQKREAFLAEMEKVERKMKAEFEAEEKASSGSAAYIKGVAKKEIERVKVALPFIMDMSDQLGIDLLQLSGSHLEYVLGLPNLEDVKKAQHDILELVTRQCDLIQNKGDPAKCMRTVSSLSSFLTGSIPTEIKDDHLLACKAFNMAKTRSCQTSEWRCELGRAWNWLENTNSSWKELEERINKALGMEPSSENLGYVTAVWSELISSSLSNEQATRDLARRISSIAQCVLTDAGTTIARQTDADTAAAQREKVTMCLVCREKEASLRFYPCTHKCLCLDCVVHSLPSQSEVEALKEMNFHQVMPGDPSIVCKLCKADVKAISVQ